MDSIIAFDSTAADAMIAHQHEEGTLAAISQPVPCWSDPIKKVVCQESCLQDFIQRIEGMT